MKKIAGFVLSVAALAMATPAAAQFQKPEDAVKYRQSAFTIMGNHMGRVGAMVMGRVPFDAKAAQDSTRVLALVSTLPG
jgi:cytochrome c556